MGKGTRINRLSPVRILSRTVGLAAIIVKIVIKTKLVKREKHGLVERDVDFHSREIVAAIVVIVMMLLSSR